MNTYYVKIRISSLLRNSRNRVFTQYYVKIRISSLLRNSRNPKRTRIPAISLNEIGSILVRFWVVNVPAARLASKAAAVRFDPIITCVRGRFWRLRQAAAPLSGR